MALVKSFIVIAPGVMFLGFAGNRWGPDRRAPVRLRRNEVSRITRVAVVISRDSESNPFRVSEVGTFDQPIRGLGPIDPASH